MSNTTYDNYSVIEQDDTGEIYSVTHLATKALAEDYAQTLDGRLNVYVIHNPK